MRDSVTAKPAILILADISGYTNFLIANNLHEERRSELLIGELLEEIIRQAELPLKVSKLEGDAIFLYAFKPEGAEKRKKVEQQIGDKLLLFFQAFGDGLVRLSGSKLCYGNHCKNLDKLNPKVIVHSGEALMHRIDKFEELAGVDVIIAHRLLKNSVPYDHYILLSESAHKDIKIPQDLERSETTEHYDDVGDIKTYVYLPPEHDVCPVTI